MQYADDVQQVLLRKINKAEQDLLQLKLDYCRFIFGLTHRSQVQIDGQVYQVQSVDIDSMTRQEDGAFNRPALTGVPLNSGAEAVAIGEDWTLVTAATREARG